MQETPSTSSLVDSIFNAVSQEDWESGLDLYETAKISKITVHDTLISSELVEYAKKLQINIKIHPSMNQIQWMECSCIRNRKSSVLCEHIVATLMHLAHNPPKHLKAILGKANLNPALRPKKTSKTAVSESAGMDASLEFIDRFKDKIDAFEIDELTGDLQLSYKITDEKTAKALLSPDQAVQFFGSNPTALNKLKLKVYGIPLQPTLFIEKQKGDRFLISSSYTIQMTKSVEKSFKNLSSNLKNHILDTHKFAEEKSGTVKSTPTLVLKTHEFTKLHKQNYFYLDKVGYFPVFHSASFNLPELQGILSKSLDHDDFLEIYLNTLPKLRSTVQILLAQSVPVFTLHTEPLSHDISILSSENGWYYLDPTYTLADSKISIVDLIRLQQQKKRKYMSHGSMVLKLPDWMHDFDWDFSEDNKSLKMNSLQVLRYMALSGNRDQMVGTPDSLEAFQKLVDFHRTEAPFETADSHLCLRDYQKSGVTWLWWLFENNLSGLLADEMGLGKTHQALAVLSMIKFKNKDARFLVVCPTTVLDHWTDKIQRFCPTLQSHAHHGPTRLENQDALTSPKNDLILTSYGVLLRDIEILRKVSWTVCILDEAHTIKNSRTSTYQAACHLNSQFRLALSGTPIENHLTELKSLFDFLLPGLLGSDSYFRKNFVKVETVDTDDKKDLLSRWIHPFKLRRVKKSVLKDLPEKVLDHRFAHLTPEQIGLYQEVIQQKARPLVSQLESQDGPLPYLHVFAVINLLKQICDHPLLVAPESYTVEGQSGKFEVFCELIQEAIDSGQKVVVYSQYLKMIDIISRYLTSSDIPHTVLTGQSQARGKIIERFQTDDSVKVMVASLLAGGVGIDLTAASVVIHYDRWWNPSKEDQATDRVHRIGQNRNVQVFKLITRGTIEEKINEIIERKKDLIDKLITNDEDLLKSFTRDDIIEILKG